jgi:hypothetical protein
MPVPVPTSWMLIATPLVWPLHVSFWVLTFVLHFLGIIHQEDSLEAAARYTNILAVTFLVCCVLSKVIVICIDRCNEASPTNVERMG